MRLASFTVDLTPPIGFPLAFGFNQAIDSPIYLRGVVLEDGRKRTVLAVADFIGFHGAAYHQWRNLVATAVGTAPRRVLLHTVHQHDSLRPLGPAVLRAIRGRADADPNEAAGWQALRERAAVGIRRQLGRSGSGWRTVKHIGTAERRLSGLGANRRLLGPDGKVKATRFSMTTRAELKREPIGRIDPLLRTLGFFGSRQELLASLHFYASHPMGAYGRAKVSADVPGVALEQLNQSVAGAAHLYFTGCGADVTFGKYTTANKEKNLDLLGSRLGQAMIHNTRALTPRPVRPLKLHYTPLEMPLDSRRHSAAHYRRELARAGTRHAAVKPALQLETLRNWKRWKQAELVRLDLAPNVQILSLPAETPIEFQLHVQARLPDHFLACAAYGDCTYQYICPQRMFEEGGYEPEASLCTGAIGEHYYRALDRLLDVGD